MQTFLPLGDFAASARSLDRARLGKQRVECWQILGALTGRTRGWANHPCVRMWRGHEAALASYAVAVCDEWIGRGYRDSMRERFVPYLVADPVMPPWLGDEAFHVSHRSSLVGKDPGHYGPLWPGTPVGLPYVWPVG